MQNKGFTLIELLVVISVLAIVSLIAVPNINDTINNASKRALNEQKKVIKSGAKQWAIEHINELPNESSLNKWVTLGELKSDGYVDNDICNPETNKLFDNNNTKVNIYLDNKNNLKYDAVFTDSDISCSDGS